MSINDALTALVDDLAAGDVPDPLAQSFTLAAVWYDLCRLAGEPVPAIVAAIVDPPRPPRPARPVRAVPKPGQRLAIADERAHARRVDNRRPAGEDAAPTAGSVAATRHSRQGAGDWPRPRSVSRRKRPVSTVHTDPDTGIQTIDPAYEAWVQEAVAHPEAFLDAVIERQIAAELARLRVLDHHGNGVDRLVALLAERQQHAVCAIGGDAWEAAAGR